MAMSPREQIDKLRRTARLAWIPKGLLALTLLFITLGFLNEDDAFFVLSAFLGIAAVASREAAPHWRNAIQAIQTGVRSRGEIFIAVTRDPTSFHEYVAIVRDNSKSTWQFRFSPRYWIPVEGDYKAEIYHILDVEWPVLVLTEGGILFPALKPRKIIENA